ncbi:hypothetical protein JB92DRAFT_3057174 [Gautieria morchelliformis]|nr:hypothetical protein JB92DRAFT_3057174 [Gautieria morchelliformis]
MRGRDNCQDKDGLKDTSPVGKLAGVDIPDIFEPSRKSASGSSMPIRSGKDMCDDVQFYLPVTFLLPFLIFFIAPLSPDTPCFLALIFSHFLSLLYFPLHMLLLGSQLGLCELQTTLVRLVPMDACALPLVVFFVGV